MTDKQIIETLRNVKEYCISHAPCYCSLCKFYMNTGGCRIYALISRLEKEYPARWDMEKIERIINETD